MVLKVNIKTVASVFCMGLILSGQSAFSSEHVWNEENHKEGALSSSSSSSSCEQDAYDLSTIEFGFEDDSISTVGGLWNSALTTITPKLSYESNDSFATKVGKSMVNMGATLAVKEGIKCIPVVGSTIAATHTTYSKTEKDLGKGEGSIARNVGNTVKELIHACPGGESIIGMAEQLKSPGTETLAESVLLSLLPATSTKCEGTFDEITGSVAKSAVISYIPGGIYITGVTGAIGQSVFGTPTLAGGLVKTGMGAMSSFYGYFSGPAVSEGELSDEESE